MLTTLQAYIRLEIGLNFDEWPPFGHESIERKPLTALEQWKVFRHRSLWLVVSN